MDGSANDCLLLTMAKWKQINIGLSIACPQLNYYGALLAELMLRVDRGRK